ncbi:MAG: hypothetical protein H7Z72_01395 [Bacteroidetes bacterium]|nr:hypothetical protein [Fibrella sp.]
MKPIPHIRLSPLFGASSPSLLHSGATSPVNAVIRPLSVWVAAAGLFMASQAASGQSIGQNYALLTGQTRTAVTPQEPMKAFWVMTPDPGTDSTMVAFFTPDNRLIHQEKLPNAAVKPTKKTIRTMNETMDRLTAANAPAATANTVSEALAGRAPGQLQVGTYASRDGIHLHLMLENPDRDYVLVNLLDTRGRSVYQTSTRADKYHYKFNLDGMPVGNYQLQVLGKKQRFERELTFNYPQPEPQLPTLRIAVK